MSTLEPAVNALEPGASEAVGVFGRVETCLRSVSDRLNPLLVKECRQALKGRQFAATFAVLLFGSWFWSLAGIAIIGPEAYYTPVGPMMFFGYYLLLAFPLTVVVPYGAFRSMAAECEDRTFELVSITTLGPRQIISGKIGSALMQMVVYLSAVSPCLAFTYLLRGIDIISAGVLMTYLIVGSLGLSMFSLLLATVAREKHTQVAMSILLLLGLGIVFMTVCQMVGSLLWLTGLPTDQPDFWINVAWQMTALISFFVLFFVVAASQITFAADNRSTATRVVLVVQQLLYVGWLGYAVWRWKPSTNASSVVVGSATFLGIFWYVMGVFLVGETGELSRRVKRNLPQSFMGRVFLTWFNPGPGTGYVFTVANLAAGAFLAGVWAIVGGSGAYTTTTNRPHLDAALCFLVLGLCYIAIYLGLSKLLLTWLRRVMRVGPLLTALVPFLLLLFGVSVPTIIYAMSTQRGSGYSLLQITNPFWTLTEIGADATLPSETFALMTMLPVFAGIIFVMNLPGVARELAQVRIAAPKRVLEDSAPT
ncbi:MAG TPA: hypothetical protein VHV77_15670 [Pirellulales bacterium]|nr:hypothetical protein [Pirellulales bacterium]